MFENNCNLHVNLFAVITLLHLNAFKDHNDNGEIQ